MVFTDNIIAALIGAGAALLVVLLKDIVISLLTKRGDLQLQLISMRMEKAYAPLDHLLYLHQVNEVGKESTQKEIKNILQRYGYLLTDKTLSGFYVLVEADDDLLNTDTVGRFFNEYEQLRTSFYKAYASRQNFDDKRNLFSRWDNHGRTRAL